MIKKISFQNWLTPDCLFLLPLFDIVSYSPCSSLELLDLFPFWHHCRKLQNGVLVFWLQYFKHLQIYFWSCSCRTNVGLWNLFSCNLISHCWSGTLYFLLSNEILFNFAASMSEASSADCARWATYADLLAELKKEEYGLRTRISLSTRGGSLWLRRTKR